MEKKYKDTYKKERRKLKKFFNDISTCDKNNKKTRIIFKEFI